MKGRAAQVEDSVNMNVERAVPIVRRNLEELSIDRAARRMHEHVERTEPGGGLVNAPRGFRGLGAIGDDQFAPTAEGFDFSFGGGARHFISGSLAVSCSALLRE